MVDDMFVAYSVVTCESCGKRRAIKMYMNKWSSSKSLQSIYHVCTPLVIGKANVGRIYCCVNEDDIPTAEELKEVLNEEVVKADWSFSLVKAMKRASNLRNEGNANEETA